MNKYFKGRRSANRGYGDTKCNAIKMEFIAFKRFYLVNAWFAFETSYFVASFAIILLA